MTAVTPRPLLKGKKALIVGVAGDQSIAWGCARAFGELEADLAITYLNQKAKPYVEPLAKSLQADIIMPLDVSQPGQLEAVFDAIRNKWGRLDILVHSIAFAPKKEDLQGGLINCSADGFAKAMDISCHSFVHMAKLAAPLMTGRIDVRDELPRGQRGRAKLQRDGAGQGRTRSLLPLPGL